MSYFEQINFNGGSYLYQGYEFEAPTSGGGGSGGSSTTIVGTPDQIITESSGNIVTLALANTTVNAGTYNSPNLLIDAYGRILSATSTSAAKFPAQVLHLFPTGDITLTSAQLNAFINVTPPSANVTVTVPATSITDGSYVIIARQAGSSGGTTVTVTTPFGSNPSASLSNGDMVLGFYSAGTGPNGTWYWTPLSAGGNASQWYQYPALANVDMGNKYLYNVAEISITGPNNQNPALSIMNTGNFIFQTYDLPPILTLNVQNNTTSGNELGSFLTTCDSSKPTLVLNAGALELHGKDNENNDMVLSSVNLPVPTVPNWSTVNASQDVNFNSFNCDNVSDITMAGLAPTIRNLTGTLNVIGAGLLSLTSLGSVVIGSANVAGTSTSLEYFNFKDNVVSAKNSNDPLQINDVASIGSDAGTVSFGNNQVSISGTNGTAIQSVQVSSTPQASSISTNNSKPLTLSQVSEISEFATTGLTVSSNGVLLASTSTTRDPWAILDIQSTNKGVYLPRMTQAQRTAIGAPQNGMILYDTTAGCYMMYGPRGWAKFALAASELGSETNTYVDDVVTRIEALEDAVRTMNTALSILFNETLAVENYTYPTINI